MVPSHLAFLDEFESDLVSDPLRRWFDVAREREPLFADFANPQTLREFLQADDRDPRKPQVWRALVQSFQKHPEPARLFVLGLLEPALCHLIDKVDEFELDPEDLWQETIACALEALDNRRLPARRQVLKGLVKDTYKLLCRSVRRELVEAKGDESLLSFAIDSDFGDPETTFMLAVWCRRAGVKARDEELIRATRIQGTPLSQLAMARSSTYNRLLLRRYRAERRLRDWLTRSSGRSDEGSM